MILKITFSSCLRLALVSFLLAIVLHEGSAEITSYHRKVFRARQAEARRNRIKYRPGSGNLPSTGFILKKDYTEFVWPELSNDANMVQTFTLYNDQFELVCRKREQPDSMVTLQRGALNTLKRGKPYFYSANPRHHESTFEFIPSPLTETEKREIQTKNKEDNMCGPKPMAGLRPIKEKGLSTLAKRTLNRSSIVEHTYGENKNTCHYFQYGIETIKSQSADTSRYAKIQIDSSWANLFNICHDETNLVTAFTKHTIKWDHLVHRKLNPNVKVDPVEEKIFVDPEMDKFYDLANQRKSFKSRQFEKERNAFDEESNYLVRAHLVPDHDTFYESWQYVTRNYLNYAPQWRSVNMGQWLKVEQHIRDLAIRLKKDLTVYTGVYYRKNSPRLIIPLQEEDDDASTSSKKKVEPKSIPIPSLFYKYVHSNMAGIVIITANGVSGSIDEIGCTNVCDSFNWMYTDPQYRHRNDELSGKTKCCTPEDFFNQKEMKTSPTPLPISKIMNSKILTFDGREVINSQKGNAAQDDPQDAPATRFFGAEERSAYELNPTGQKRKNYYVLGAD